MNSVTWRVCFLLILGFTFVSSRAASQPSHDTLSDTEGSKGDIVKLLSSLNTLQTKIGKYIQASNNKCSENQECISKIKNLTLSHSVIQSQLEDLQMEISKRNTSESKAILIKNVIEDIRNQNFEEADKKFSELNDTNALSKIVHEVYAGSQETIKLVLNFSIAASDPIRCLDVQKTLHKEILANNPDISLDLIYLLHSIEAESLNCSIDDTTLRKEILRDIEKIAVENLAKSIENYLFIPYNLKGKAILDALNDFYPDVSEIVVKKVIDKIFRVELGQQVLLNIYAMCKTPQAIVGISHIFWKAKDIGFVSQGGLLSDIVSDLSEIKGRSEFNAVRESVKRSFDDVIENLPKCFKSVFYKEPICLKNKDKNVYLIAIDDKFNNDDSQRRVLTAASTQGVPEGAIWIPSIDHSRTTFQNKKYENEYLSFGEYTSDDGREFTFTRIPDSRRPTQFIIVLAKDAESCYLKVWGEKRYMIATDLKYEKDSNYSYAAVRVVDPNDDLNSGLAWKFEACEVKKE